MSVQSPLPVRRRTDPIEILIEASEIVARHSLNLDALLRRLRDLVRKVVDCQVFAILLRVENRDELRIRDAVGYRNEVIRNLRVKIGEGITGVAAKERRTVFVDDVHRDPRYLLAVDGVHSEIAVPLIARNRLVGVIDLQSTHRGAFGEYERNMLELIGSRFSLAIDAARLYRATLRQNRALATLSRIAQEFTHILNLEELLNKISSLVRRQIPYDALSILLLEKEKQTLRHYFGVRFDERMRWDNMPLGRGIVGTAAQLGEPVLVRDTNRDPRYVAMVDGIRSEVAIPLMLKDEVFGVLDLESEHVEAFNRDHVRMLSLLAPQMAIAIDNARLYEEVARNEDRLGRDLTAARELQQHLLPETPPEFDGIEIAARNHSAAVVSGDLYEFFPFPGENLGILLGDVSGKGAAAALYGALVSGLLRNLVQPHQRPKALLDQANQALLKRKIEARYLTALYAQWHPGERRLTIANAGHPQPIHCRDGKAEVLRVSGIPLGLMEVSRYEDFSVSLSPGDTIVFVSDGITEAEDSNRVQFGERELLEIVQTYSNRPPNEIIEKIAAGLQEFTGRSEAGDDRTAIVFRVKE